MIALEDEVGKRVGCNVATLAGSGLVPVGRVNIKGLGFVTAMPEFVE